MRAVDINVLVRLFSRDDRAQSIAADAFVKTGAWLSHLVLVEAVWVLGSVYARDATSLATFVRMLLEHESLVVQDADTVEAALSLFVAQPKLGFSDCLILEVAHKAGYLPMGTFDRAFAKQPGVQKV
jgi:predicted nucleic-acid-binding protein